MAICSVPARNMAGAKMLARRREAMLPAMAVNRTAPNQRFTGLFSLPIMPTAKLAQTTMKPASTANIAPMRKYQLDDKRTESSMRPPTMPKMIVATMKSVSSQSTSLVNCIATSGVKISAMAPPQPMTRQGFRRRRWVCSLAIVITLPFSGDGGYARNAMRHCKHEQDMSIW